MRKKRVYACTGFVSMALSCLMLVLPVPHAAAATQVEGALEAGLVPPVVSMPDVPLRSLAIDPQTEETAYDYLVTIENELLTYDKANLLHGGAQSYIYSLQDCLEMAIERHLPIEIARDKISLHRRKLVKALRDLFPALNLSYEHDLGFKLLKADTAPGDHSNQQFRSERWRMALSQPIFRGGSLWNKVNEERANVRAAQAEYDKVFLDLSLEVARSYFNFAKSKTVVTYKTALLKQAQQSLYISEEKMNAALISEIEHLNVQSQESQIQHDVEAAREDIALGLLDLQKALHFDVSERVEVEPLDQRFLDAIQKELDATEKKGAQSEEAQEQELNRYIAQAYENRPEFIIQKSKVDAAMYREKAAVGGWFPQLNFQLERGQKAEAYKEDDNNPPWDTENRVVFDAKWNIVGNTLRYMYDKNRQGTGVEATERLAGIGADGYYDRRNIVSVSVLDGLDQFIQTKEAEIGRKEALLELELSEKDIVSEVKESYFNYNRALIQLKSVFKRLAYRQKLVELAQHRSEINEIQISEYLQAEIDLINERDTLYKAVVDFFVAKISLNKAIGSQDTSVTMLLPTDAGV